METINILNHSNSSTIQANRIVSLVPSQTELLHYLGLENQVIGITKFCIHPTDWFRTKTRIGGTKNIDIKKVQLLQPTLVIANKEENVQTQVEEIAAFCPVIVTDIHTLSDVYTMTAYIGSITHTDTLAQLLIESIQQKFQQLHTFYYRQTHKTVVYLIWREPYMTVGGDTFINHMLQECGFVNIFINEKRYPIITIATLQNMQPDYIFLSTEPYPFGEQHVKELQMQLPNSKIILVDGEMFSWYGSRLLKSTAYFMQLIQSLLN